MTWQLLLAEEYLRQYQRTFTRGFEFQFVIWFLQILDECNDVKGRGK
jgi:hypothetical protein